MKRCAGILAIVLYLLLPTSVAAAECQLVLGFKTLRDLIGHEIVGECLENEHHGANGDALQQTTGGLLVWRKADNWTAFTDGYRTWINGPNGLVQRLNTQRFEWEADYAPGGGIATPTPAPYAPTDTDTGCVRHGRTDFTEPAVGAGRPNELGKTSCCVIAGARWKVSARLARPVSVSKEMAASAQGRRVGSTRTACCHECYR